MCSCLSAPRFLFSLLLLAAGAVLLGSLDRQAPHATPTGEALAATQLVDMSADKQTVAATKTGATLDKAVADPKGEPFREETGELRRGDDQLEGGEYVDYYTLEATEGETLVVTLESEDFDTYLIVSSDDDDEERWDNDDYQGLTTRSQIEFIVPTTGSYTVAVTSYDARERGDYSLSFSRLEVTLVEGELGPGDETLESGEYIDWYEIEGRPGEMIVIDLTSEEFDCYLILEDTEGNHIENDDHEAGSTDSHIENNMFDAGIHRIGVTSYEPEETGNYELRYSFREGVTFEEVNESGELRRDLSGDEVTLADGSYADGYLFWAEEDDTVVIDMQSSDFDTYLLIRGPAGMDEHNDDYEGSTDSRIAFRCRQSGHYQLIASTYSPGATGDYSISFDLDANKYGAGKWAVGEHGQVYGVFVGIAEYPNDSLAYCDQDAERMYDVFKRRFNMQAENARLLVNDEATVGGVSHAVRELIEDASDEDMFVFFYSGHGGQEMNGRGDEFDPDGTDETLALYDGALLDDRLAELFDEGDPGACLVVIDSCHSGGFAKDIVCREGRIGYFSSEGDCLSVVADKEGAGGYLSLFFHQAFHKDLTRADANQDRMLTVHELSYYLQEQFEEVVQSGRTGRPSQLYPSGPIDPGEDLGYQRILSDRDGVSPHLILLDW